MKLSDLEIKKIEIDLADQLLKFSELLDESTIKEWCDEEGDCYIPVRLQFFDKDRYYLHYFDASWDTDHRGYWGDSAVHLELAVDEALYIAKYLLDKALDDSCFE